MLTNNFCILKIRDSYMAYSGRWAHRPNCCIERNHIEVSAIKFNNNITELNKFILLLDLMFSMLLANKNITGSRKKSFNRIIIIKQNCCLPFFSKSVSTKTPYLFLSIHKYTNIKVFFYSMMVFMMLH